MKKVLSVFVICIICITMLPMLSGCGCEHDELEVESTTATCTEAGVTTYYCIKCGEKGVRTRNVEAFGHNFNTNVEENNNKKCERCDLVWQKVTFNNEPKTIVAKHSSTSLGDFVLAEFNVNGVEWTINKDMIEVLITVTPTLVNVPNSSDKGVAFISKLYGEGGREVILISNQIEFSNDDLGKPQTVRCFTKAPYGFDDYHQVTHYFNADVFTSLTMGYNNSRYYALISYTK